MQCIYTLMYNHDFIQIYPTWISVNIYPSTSMSASGSPQDIPRSSSASFSSQAATHISDMMVEVAIETGSEFHEFQGFNRCSFPKTGIFWKRRSKSVRQIYMVRALDQTTSLVIMLRMKKNSLSRGVCVSLKLEDRNNKSNNQTLLWWIWSI